MKILPLSQNCKFELMDLILDRASKKIRLRNSVDYINKQMALNIKMEKVGLHQF